MYMCVLPAESEGGHEECQRQHMMGQLTFGVNPKYNSQVPTAQL
jgi:hypothetical protein